MPMEESIRLFVAATLPVAAKEFLAQQSAPFADPAVRFIPEQNLHLTLFFIGNVPLARLPDLKQAIQLVAQQHAPLTLELERLEPGPKPASPRLIWARFRQHPGFEQLSLALTQALAAQPPKQQKAIPHVTLARFRKDRPTPRHLPAVVPEEPLQLRASAVSLWQSQLASPHPVYTVLETYPLGRNP